MNTTEQIVESYFRICKECFTVPDVKVPEGNGRQLDLLAYSLRERLQYHIEVQVSHARHFAPPLSKIFAKLDAKFLGKPNERERKKQRRKKWYIREIQYAYTFFGFDPFRVKRVWVCWEVPKVERFSEELAKYNAEREQEDNPISVLSFKEGIIPELKKRIKTAHYDDVSLRTISLFNQGKRQDRIDREKGKQREMP